jgi:iron complex outermembrane receptor protein
MKTHTACARRSSRLSIAVALALSTNFPVSAFAQTADSGDSDSAKMLDTVTVTGQREPYFSGNTSSATKTDTPLLLTPQSVSVVTRAVLDDQNAQNLTDALRNVSGSGSDFGFNGSDLPIIILRGFPTVSMTARGPVGGAASYYLDGTRVQGMPVIMPNVESVEVVKGPASVLYGRSEPGGLINIVTRGASRDFGTRFDLTVGSYDLFSADAEVTGSLNDTQTVFGRAAASYSHADSIRHAVTDRLTAFSGTLAFAPVPGTEIALSADYSNQSYRSDFGIPAIGDRPADIPLENQFNEGWPLNSTESLALRLEYDQTLSDNWNLNFNGFYLDQQSEQYDIIPTTFFSGQASLIATGYIDRFYSYFPEGDRNLYQFNVDFIGDYQFGDVQNRFLIGIDTYSDSFDTLWIGYVPAPAINIYNPVYGNVPELDLSTVPLIPSESRTRWTGVYLQDQVAFDNGLNLVAALRYETTSARYGDPGGEYNDGSYFTPRVGILWNFAGNQSVYAQYQDSVAANNGSSADGSPLDSEQAEQIEIGHKIEGADGKWMSTIALYQLTKRNIANYVFSPTSPTGFDVVTVGEARSHGLEWDLSGQLTDSLSVIASYAYTDADITKDTYYAGLKLPNAALHSGSVWVRFAVNKNWNLGTGVFFQSQRQGDLPNSFQLPGYARFDAMAGYLFKWGNQDAVAQLNFNNIFNKRYFTGSHQLVTDWIAPGEPRTLAFTLRLEY